MGCSNWFQTDRRGRGFTGMACKIFDRSKLVPSKNSRRECVRICGDRTKQEWYYVLLTRIKSSSNLLIFLLCFFVVSCWLHASGAFFACCRTCNVLILSQIMPDNQCMFNEQRNTSFYTVEIWLLPLNFFLTVDGHLENPTIVNLSRFGEFQKQRVLTRPK